MIGTHTAAAGQEASGLTADIFRFRLYVVGQTDKSLIATINIKSLCEKHLSGRYHIELIDLLRNPGLAATDQIIAVPTLIRQSPLPVKRMIGTLSDFPQLLAGMDIPVRAHLS